jgi:hypothetical protein
MKTLLQFRERADFMRESSGSNIEKALIKAVKMLALFHIPHYVCGGFAVQEYGYPRFTVDVDIIVPDVDFAREKLAMNGFKENPGSKMTVTDRTERLGWRSIFCPVVAESIRVRSRFRCLHTCRTSRRF